jgi:hypothetical protein
VSYCALRLLIGLCSDPHINWLSVKSVALVVYFFVAIYICELSLINLLIRKLKTLYFGLWLFIYFKIAYDMVRWEFVECSY